MARCGATGLSSRLRGHGRASGSRGQGTVSEFRARNGYLEPSDDMVEVAVASLLAALSAEEVAQVEQRGPIVAAALAAEREEPANG